MDTNSNPSPSAEDLARAFKTLHDIMTRFGSGFSAQTQTTIKTLEDANKALGDLEDSSEQLQKTQDGINKDAKFSRSMFGENSKALGNLKNKLEDGAAHLKNLGKQIEQAEAAYSKLSATATPQEREAAQRRINDARIAHDAAQATHGVLDERVKGISKAISVLPGSFVDIAKAAAGAAKSILSIETSLLAGGDAITFASGVLKTGIDAAASSAKAVGTGLDGLGTALMSFPSPWSIGVGAILKGAGMLATGLAEASEVAKEGVTLLEQELGKTVTAYRNLSSVGANFATGMEEMRAAAVDAAMPLVPFSAIVTANAQAFSEAGLSMSGATKKFAQLSKSMSESGLREKIFELGYTVEEFGGITADVMANLNASGQLRNKSDEEIAQLTYEYAKNLRLISDLTGQDARKRMEQARKDSLRAGVYDKIMQQAGQGGVDKLRQAMNVLPEEIKTMINELAATQGQGFASAASNILAENSPELKNAVMSIYRDIVDPTKDSTLALTNLIDQLSNAGEALKKPQGALGDIGAGAVLGAGGKAAEVSTQLSSLRAFLIPFANLSAEERLKQITGPKDETTVKAAQLQEEKLRTISKAEAMVGPALSGFAGILTTTTGSVGAFNDKIVAAVKALGGYVNLGSGTTGATPASGPVTLPSGQTVTVNDGGLFPEFSKWLSEHGLGAMGSSKPKFASGGITSGVSIAGERGPEAVVPLPDGRTIPVNIQSMESNYSSSGSSANSATSKMLQDLTEFFRTQNKTIQNNANTLESILTVLRDSYDTQDRLLTNSY